MNYSQLVVNTESVNDVLYKAIYHYFQFLHSFLTKYLIEDNGNKNIGLSGGSGNGGRCGDGCVVHGVCGDEDEYKRTQVLDEPNLIRVTK